MLCFARTSCKKFDVLLEKLCEPFYVSTLVWESILLEKDYCYCPILINHNKKMDDLFELDMVDFYVILGKYWLQVFYPSIDCRTRLVRFQTPNE